MPINKHQRKHINAMLTEIQELRDAPIAVKRKWADGKNLSRAIFIGFLDKMETRLKGIKASGSWPAITDEKGRIMNRPSAIHDFFEKRTSEFRK